MGQITRRNRTFGQAVSDCRSRLSDSIGVFEVETGCRRFEKAEKEAVAEKAESLRGLSPEETAQKIDEEVSKMVERLYNKTKQLLLEHREELDKLAERLLDKEVVLKEHLTDIFHMPEGKEIENTAT